MSQPINLHVPIDTKILTESIAEAFSLSRHRVPGNALLGALSKSIKESMPAIDELVTGVVNDVLANVRADLEREFRGSLRNEMQKIARGLARRIATDETAGGAK